MGHLVTRSYSLQLSEPMVRSAARAYVLRFVDWKFLACIAVLLIFLIDGLASGDRSMLLGFAAAVVAFASFIVVRSVLGLQARASRLHKRLGGAPVVLVADDTKLRFSSSMDSFEIVASDISQLRRHGEFLLLIYREGGYSTLPLADLGPEGAAWIESFVGRAGGKVV